MTSKLVLFVMFPCLIIALMITLINPDITHIAFGNTYYNFMGNVSRAYSNWSISIPKIPTITVLQDTNFDDSGLILSVLIKVGKAIIGFFNIIITLLNVLVMILNIAIQLIQFCLTLIWCLIDFRDSFSPSLSMLGNFSVT